MIRSLQHDIGTKDIRDEAMDMEFQGPPMRSPLSICVSCPSYVYHGETGGPRSVLSHWASEPQIVQHATPERVPTEAPE